MPSTYVSTTRTQLLGAYRRATVPGSACTGYPYLCGESVFALPSRPTLAPSVVDLTNCDREPIHIPGAIQPYGVLLVTDPLTRGIVQASESAVALFGRPLDEIVNATLDSVLGTGASDAVDQALSRDAKHGESFRLDVPVRGARTAFDAIAHTIEYFIVVELEPASELTPNELDALLVRLRTAVANIQGSSTVAAACSAVLDAFVDIAGFDRTMVYRFDRNWNGEVIGEHLSDDRQPPYLGLHYPATDIPRQARELYTRNVLRTIPDARYVPARIVPELNPRTNRPLDMSRSKLRSVSPVHLEYMANMGTVASLTASLLHRDQLWGMISAHHRTPRHVPHRLRVALELLARAGSLQITALEERDDFSRRLQMRALQPNLIEAIDREGGFIPTVIERGELLEIAEAGGAAVKGDGEPVLIGKTPRMRDVRRIIAWLEQRGGDPDEPFVTDELPLVEPNLAYLKETAAGLLAVPLTTSRGGWMLWFRPEAVRTVNWGGDPRKFEDAAGGISPRRSFDVWKETVQLRALPWHSAHVDAAMELRRLMSDVMMRRAREYASLNAELARSNSELESFAYIAAHDLKEPLRGLRSFTTFLTDDYGKALDERARDMLASMNLLVGKMESQINSMLELARVSDADAVAESISLDRALDAALELLAPRLNEHTEIRRPLRLPDVLMNHTHARELLLNLVGNGLKYNTHVDKFVEIGLLETPDPALSSAGAPLVTVFVRDNGIGIDEKDAEAVFRMFKRLHTPDAFGGGTGAGLPIARKIVEQNGGTMWLRSIPGDGTTFYFTLPAVDAESAGG